MNTTPGSGHLLKVQANDPRNNRFNHHACGLCCLHDRLVKTMKHDLAHLTDEYLAAALESTSVGPDHKRRIKSEIDRRVWALISQAYVDGAEECDDCLMNLTESDVNWSGCELGQNNWDTPEMCPAFERVTIEPQIKREEKTDDAPE